MGRIIKRWAGGVISKSGQDRLDVGIGESYRLSGVRRSAQDTLSVQMQEAYRINGVRKQAQDGLNVQVNELANRIIRRENFLRTDAINVGLTEMGSVRPITSAGLTDNALVVVNGSGFGSFQGDVQLFTGGSANAIQSAADDTDFTTIKDPRLSVPDFLNEQKWRVDTGRTHGRSRSLLWDMSDSRNTPGGNHGEGPMVFSPGVASLDSFYFRTKIFYQLPTGTTDAQLKFLRIISEYVAEGDTDGLQDSDGNNILISDRIGQGYFGANGGTTWAPWASTTTWFSDPGWGDVGLASVPRNEWFELECEMRDPTTLSSADGYLSWSVRRLSNRQIVTTAIRNNVRLYGGAGRRYKYLMLQLGGYNGAGPNTPEWVNGQVWLEDIYFRVRSRGRIFVANNPVWASATAAEPCEEVIEARSDGQVQFRVNKTTYLPSITGLYAFIWHPNGTLVNPTSGYPI